MKTDAVSHLGTIPGSMGARAGVGKMTRVLVQDLHFIWANKQLKRSESMRKRTETVQPKSR